jgi:hypothetical protein
VSEPAYAKTLNDLGYSHKEWSDIIDGHTTDGVCFNGTTFTPSLQDLGFKEGQTVRIVGSGPPRDFKITTTGLVPSPKYPNRHEARKAAKLARRTTSDTRRY